MKIPVVHIGLAVKFVPGQLRKDYEEFISRIIFEKGYNIENFQIFSDRIELSLSGNAKQPSIIDKELSEIGSYIENELNENNSKFEDKKMSLPDTATHISDKEQVYEDSYVRVSANHSLGRVFIFEATETESEEEFRKEIKKKSLEFLENKTPNLKFLITEHIPSTIFRSREELVRQIRYDFANLPNKEQAYEDLCGFAQNENWLVRRKAVGALGSVFEYIPDKKNAWTFLCSRLAQDRDESVQRSIADVLAAVFSHIPDKKQAWSDFNGLIKYDEGIVVRRLMTGVLSTIFPQIPDKEQAWEDLHRLTQSKDRTLKRLVAYALGHNFPQIPDKKQAWEDLQELADDNHWFVRTYAYYSLGRASIFKATETENEEEFRKEMQNAIKFFGISSKEATSLRNPSSFCLPFYRSFYTVTFEKEGAKDEVQRYLTEAKRASEGSKNKETLLEAIENLANALSEAQKVTDFEPMKFDLKAYMQYCNRAADQIRNAVEDAPGAAGILKRGLPIIDQRTKEILKEIQENAELISKNTQSTPFEDFGTNLSKLGKNLSLVRDSIGLVKNIMHLENILSNICDKMPEGVKGEACKSLKIAKQEQYIEDKLPPINNVLSIISSQINFIELLEITKNIDDKTDIIMEDVQKINTSCNLILTLEKGGVTLKEEEKEELETLADDIKKANKEQLTNFRNELNKFLRNPKIKKEIERKAPEDCMSTVREAFSKIITELGIALSAAITAEELLPHIEKMMEQITILSGITPGLVSTLILIPFITLKTRTMKR